MIPPILDIRLQPGKFGCRFGVFSRPQGQLQGGRCIARFDSLDVAQGFIRVYPSIAPTSDPEDVPRGVQVARLGLLKGGRDSRMLFCGR